MTQNSVLGLLPSGLRDPLLAEYENILQSFLEGRWLPAELSGGRFCEIVFTIVEGYATGTYPTVPKKPQDFAGACRRLERGTHVPRSFQILIPRLLPALFEVRNNRGVGHVGGDVNPNFMDAAFVLTSANWVMGELVRVFHNVTTNEAQSIVDRLADRQIPLIWEGKDTRRVLQPNLTIQSQVLLLLATTRNPVRTSDLLQWIEYQNVGYFRRLLRSMHSKRLIELRHDEEYVEILPPGSREAAETIKVETTRSLQL